MANYEIKSIDGAMNLDFMRVGNEDGNQRLRRYFDNLGRFICLTTMLLIKGGGEDKTL